MCTSSTPATGPGRVTTISLPNREESHRGMPADCSDNSRLAGRCIVCRGEEGTKHRVILRCPAPMGVMRLRLLRLGTILPSPQEGREDRDVWTLGAAMSSLQSRAATHNSGLDGQHNNTAYRDATVHVHQLRPEGQELRPLGTIPAPHWRTRSCLHYLKVFLAALFCRVLIKCCLI